MATSSLQTIADIRAAAEDEVAGAVAYAEAGTWEPVDDLTRDVLTPAEALR